MWLIEAVALLVEEDGKILLIREDGNRKEVGKVAGMFSIPMGHIENGEDPSIAAVREFREETGLNAEIDYRLGFFQIEMPGGNRAGVWAYKGHILDRVKNTPFTLWLSEKEFLSLDPFLLRPLNHELFQIYSLARFIEKHFGKEMVEKILSRATPQMSNKAPSR